MTRKEEREQAFLLCFEMMFNDDFEEITENAEETRDMVISSFAKKVCMGIKDNLEEIDREIENNLAKKWKISRISKVSLSILRIAVYEMKYDSSIPASVSINEAVEIAKKFATEKDVKFINGVLGSIAKES